MKNRIKEHRLSLGLTQRDVAARLHVQQSALSMWETGKSYPRAELLPRIADALGCTIDELMREDADGKPTKPNNTTKGA